MAYNSSKKILQKISDWELLLDSTSDADNVINKFNDIVNFVNGLPEGDDLTTILAGYLNNTTDLVDSLTVQDSSKALSANQGYILNNDIEALSNSVGSAANIITSSYTIVQGSPKTIFATITSSSQVLTLPENPEEGDKITVYLYKTSTEDLTIEPFSGTGTIDGSASQSMSVHTDGTLSYTSELKLFCVNPSSQTWLTV